MSPHLRAVEPDEGRARSHDPTNRASKGAPWAIVAILGPLVVALVFLAWSRTELRSRVEALEAETHALRAELEGRERQIEAQRTRLGEVRARVDALRELLAEPLPTSE